MAVTPITKELFGQKRFKRVQDYHFASRDDVAPLALRELSRAMLNLPIAFAKVRDDWMPAAVLGLGGGKNLLVAPNGRWVGRYLPVCYRLHPFVLASIKDDKQVLCFDDESELISETEGEPFFDEHGNPSATVTEILNFLGQHSQNLKATKQLSAVLDQHGLLTSWSIKLQDEESKNHATLSGLYRVNEEVFNTLNSETLGKLHQAGALPLIYCQLLSMQHLPNFGELSKLHRSAQTPAAVPEQDALEETTMTFLSDDTAITFERL